MHASIPMILRSRAINTAVAVVRSSHLVNAPRMCTAMSAHQTRHPDPCTTTVHARLVAAHARLVAAHAATAPLAVPADGILVATMATIQALQAN